MKTSLLKLALLGFVLAAVGCAGSGVKKGKTAKESEVYLKSVQSKALDPSVKNKKLSCVVQTSIQEKSWAKIVAMANDCVQLGNFKQVERYGNHLAKHHHMGPWGAYFLSLSAENRGEMDRAIWMIELALKKTPNEGLLLYQKGRLTWAAKEYELAVKMFEESLKLRPDLLGARMMLGQLYYRDQDYSKAKKHFTAAIELDNKMSSAWVGLAECELEDGNGEAALVSLEKAIDLEPGNLDFRMREAFIYERVLKNIKQALSSYKKIRKNGGRLGMTPSVSKELNNKIEQLKGQIAQETPGAQVSKRSPAQEEEVSK